MKLVSVLLLLALIALVVVSVSAAPKGKKPATRRPTSAPKAPKKATKKAPVARRPPAPKPPKRTPPPRYQAPIVLPRPAVPPAQPAPPVVQPSSGGGAPTAALQLVLNTHNAARRARGIPPLVWGTCPLLCLPPQRSRARCRQQSLRRGVSPGLPGPSHAAHPLLLRHRTLALPPFRLARVSFLLCSAARTCGRALRAAGPLIKWLRTGSLKGTPSLLMSNIL